MNQIILNRAGRSHSYQFLGDSWRSPLIGYGVKGGVFAGGDWVCHDHTVPLIDPDAISTFYPGSEGGILGVHQQAPDFPIILQVRAQAVLLLAAFTRLAYFPGGQCKEVMSSSIGGILWL